MKYMGSKNRIAKHLLPIMLKAAEERGITTWIEPFVGGTNMIDKLPSTFERVGYDINGHVIQALIDIRDNVELLPNSVSEEEYKSYKGLPPKSLISWVRFMCSFGGKFDNGYAREKGSDDTTFCGYGKRNALKQSPNIQNVEFICDSYENLDFEDCLIYCFDKNTEILTDKGWKFVDEIDETYQCLSRQPNTNVLEYKSVVCTTKLEHENMFKYSSKMVDLYITDNHNMIVSKKYGRNNERKDVFIKPKDIKNYNFQFLSGGGLWKGTDSKTIRIGEFTLEKAKFSYILGLFLTDGSVNNQNVVTISQKKERVVSKLLETLNDLGLPHSCYVDDNGMNTIYFKSSWSFWFRCFYNKDVREIPKDFLNSNTECLQSLLDGILDGDSDNDRRRIYLSSKSLVNGIQEICFKLGLSSSYRVMNPKESTLKCGRVIKGIKPYYSVSVNKGIYLDVSSKYAEFIKDKQEVYCVTLSEWHTVLTRRNGKCVWMGQCDPPYQNSTGYKTGSFDHKKFFDWCREQAKKNIVFVSEYSAPDDFVEVWKGEVKTNFASSRKQATHNAVEKLFRVY